MGQAKRRGTFDERVTQAVQRDNELLKKVIFDEGSGRIVLREEATAAEIRQIRRALSHITKAV